MISWIQQTFQQHFRVVFMVLLAAVVISFVFVIGASPGLGHGDRAVAKQEFFGLNLASAEDARRFQQDAAISVELQYGFSGFAPEQIQQFAMIRQASLFLANQLHVPAPTENELKEAIQKLRYFMGPNGQFDATKYNTFRESLSKNPNLSAGDITRIIGDNVRIERVQKLVSGPGFVLPADVRSELEQIDTSWSLQVAEIDRKAYAPALTPAETDLTKFFEENSFRYQIAPQVVVSYLEFPAQNYAAGVAVNEDELRAFFEANPSRFAKPDPTKVGETPTVEFAQVRGDVEKAFVLERARRLAAEAATQASLALDKVKALPGTDAFNLALSELKLKAKDVAPFSQDQVPAELGGGAVVAEQAFRLSRDRTVSDALVTDKGAVILLWRDTLAARQPEFAAVRARVLADYTENERAKRFVSAGATLRSLVQAKVKSGVAFGKAVEEAALGQGLKVTVKAVGPFTLRTPPADFDGSIAAKLATLKQGDVSEMAATAEKGLLVYAAERKVPDLSEANPNYAELRTQMAAQTASYNAGDYLQDMISRELAKSGAEVAR